MAKFGAAGSASNSQALARIAARLEGVSEAAIRKADARAVATIRRRFEPAAKRMVREGYAVKAGDLAGKFQVRTSMEGGSEVLQLYASTRKLPLIGFGGKWAGRKSPGATAGIEPGRRKVYTSAFIATINGTRRMLVRQFSSGSHLPSGRDPRNKLRSLTGPSPLQMVRGRADDNAARLSREMNKLRSSEILRQLRLASKGAL